MSKTDPALGRAVAWFSERGFKVSMPVQPVGYDLIAESDINLLRIAVKSTSSRDDKSGSWRVNLGTRDPKATVGQPELFWVRTGDNDVYLIPIGAVRGKQRICLDNLYAAYKMPPK